MGPQGNGTGVGEHGAPRASLPRRRGASGDCGVPLAGPDPPAGSREPAGRLLEEFRRHLPRGILRPLPLFINERPAPEVIDASFIAGDSHWSAAGHRLVADALLGRMRAVSGTGP